MSATQSDRPNSQRIWSVPVALAEVPESGRHFELVADEHRRAAIARLAGVAALPRLAARLDLSRHGRNGLHVTGQVSATVGQICGVTLEPMESEIEEPIDLVFTSEAASPTDAAGGKVEIPLDDGPEPLL